MDWIEHQLLLFIIAFIANLFSALAGGGADLIQLPVLLLLGLPFSVALPTHKIASVALGVGATICHVKAAHFNKIIITAMLLTGLPGVLLGANVILLIKDQFAQVLLGLLTCSLCLYSVFRPQLGQRIQLKNQNLKGYIMGGCGRTFIHCERQPLYQIQL